MPKLSCDHGQVTWAEMHFTYIHEINYTLLKGTDMGQGISIFFISKFYVLSWSPNNLVCRTSTKSLVFISSPVLLPKHSFFTSWAISKGFHFLGRGMWAWGKAECEHHYAPKSVLWNVFTLYKVSVKLCLPHSSFAPLWPTEKMLLLGYLLKY